MRHRKPKPVQNIELSEKNIKLRVILLVASLILAMLAFGYGISSCLSVDKGWSNIEYNGSELNCSNEFIFMYDLGSGDASATADYRNLTKLYTEMTEKAYKLFNSDETFADVNSIAYVNQHVNETVKLDPALYNALKKFTEKGNRYIYMASVYSEYEAMFFGYNGSVESEQYDPYKDPETAEYFEKLAGYAGADEHIKLEFLSENQVCLKVSQEYLSYANDKEIPTFVSFMWLKNAFIIDYLADTLKANGYTNGTLTSYDGFTRNLDTRGESYKYNLFDLNGNNVYLAAKMEYNKSLTIVYLKGYMVDELDRWHYYVKADGGIVTPYIDTADGLYKNAVGSMMSYAENAGCADVVLGMIPIYVSDSLDTDALNGLTEKGLYTVWFENGIAKYNEKSIKLSEFFNDGTVKYAGEYAGK
jgi:hypothetical protein